MIIHLTKTFQIIIHLKSIPDADSKKIIPHHVKLKKHAWRLHEQCVENMKKREIQRHDKREACCYKAEADHSLKKMIESAKF